MLSAFSFNAKDCINSKYLVRVSMGMLVFTVQIRLKIVKL